MSECKIVRVLELEVWIFLGQNIVSLIRNNSLQFFGRRISFQPEN